MTVWKKLLDQLNLPSSLIQLDTPYPIQLWLKREDLIHPELNGNKWRKLKYNLLKYLNGHYTSIQSYGGVFSNHIAALSFACHKLNIPNTVLIRGDDHAISNPTMIRIQELGSKIRFVTRSEYRTIKNDHNVSSDILFIPEGGSNPAAIAGIGEMVKELRQQLGSFDYLVTPVGSCGTIMGCANALPGQTKAIGILALKALDYTFPQYLQSHTDSKFPILLKDYHWGGFAKTPLDLISFMRTFHTQFGIQLDPIYTGKMMYAIFDLCKKGYFPEDSKVVAVHTGGIQGITGWEYRWQQKLYKREEAN